MLSSQSITTDNTNTNYAKEGDTITLTFTVSETLQTTPTVTIAGHTATVTNTDNTYTATYEVQDGDDAQNITYDIGELTDTNANTHDPPQETTAITIDTTSPSFSGTPTLTSDNTDNQYAKEGDTLTLTFTLSEAIQATPTVTIAGQAATVTNTDNDYTATYEVEEGTDQGTVSYLVNSMQDLAGNLFIPSSVQSTVTVDTTAPSLDSTPTFTSDNADSDYAKEGDILTLTFTVSEALQGAPTVTIAGQAATVTANDSTYTATYTITATTPEGPATYDIGELTDITTNTFDPAQETTTITIDISAPTLSDPSSIDTTNDTTPDFTFTSSEAGTITYGGDCTSTDTTAASGENTVTFDALAEETHSNCTLTVTDAAGNISDALAVPEFTIDTTAPTLTGPSSIGSTSDTTPEFTFTSSEAGTITYGGRLYFIGYSGNKRRQTP